MTAGEDGDSMGDGKLEAPDGPASTRKSLFRLSVLILIHVFLGISISDIVAKIDKDHPVSEWKIDTAITIALGYLIWKNWQYVNHNGEWKESFNVYNRVVRQCEEYVKDRFLLEQNNKLNKTEIFTNHNNINTRIDIPKDISNIVFTRDNVSFSQTKFLIAGDDYSEIKAIGISGQIIFIPGKSMNGIPMSIVPSQIEIPSKILEDFIAKAKRKMVMTDPSYNHTRVPVYLAYIALVCIIGKIACDISLFSKIYHQ